jgi:hypothetical protein
MRVLASLLLLSGFSIVSCGGDSSSPMSVWTDGGPQGEGGAAAGGAGGSPVGGAGGSPVGGTSGSGTLAVPGGARDLATAQCIAASGGTCPVPADYINCLRSKCGDKVTACYFSDGVSAAAGGACKDYANCMLACPCNSGRSSCEQSCLQNYTGSPACSQCLLYLFTCSSSNGCTLPATCAASGS